MTQPVAAAPASPAWLREAGGGVFTIDTGFHRDGFDAAYLRVANGRAAFIDTGTNFALPRLLGALDALGLARDAVDWVIPTHVHLDHAGGAGALMRELPAARMLVHPRGARHMIDPIALYEGALAVYGPEEMARSYGHLVPVPRERVHESHDEMTLELGGPGGARLRIIDTPGHARHHHCLFDEATRGWFTGDTFGLSYREFDTDRGAWALPTSTPVQFEPDLLRVSMQRLLAAEPRLMYLTHFGPVGGVERLAELQFGLLDRVVEIGQRLKNADNRHERLKAELQALYLDSLHAHGCTRRDAAELLAIDVELNAQGIAAWLDRDARKAAR